MAEISILIPAAEIAAKNKAHFPNESPEYRKARNALLAEEIGLRRHIERVAALRRALPLGGQISEIMLSKALPARRASLSSSVTKAL
jgi:predicted dithiol-disulfide oxidoreductase (DUF899 family)